MAAHKLDQLFKKKLGQHASEPSQEAWVKMESMLNKPVRKPIWFFYRVAATILLLIFTGWATYQFYSFDDQKEGLMSTNRKAFNQDGLKVQETENIPGLKGNNETKALTRENTENVIKKTEDFPTESSHTIIEEMAVEEQSKNNNNENRIREINAETTTEKAMIAEATSGYAPEKIKAIKNQPESTSKAQKKRLPIRIIYKKGKRAQQQTVLAKNDTTSKKKFNLNSIIDATKNITSGDLLADIRDAKDDFFNQGLDFKKSQRFKNKDSNK